MKTVCILTAGVGKRLGNYSNILNKSLLPLKKKAIISYIIENFPKKTNFVIAVGHFKNQVINYLKIFHPDKKFKFVNVKDYNSIESGPGLSLLKCKKYLNKPFYFVSCDTLFNKKIYKKENGNWMGVNYFPIKNNKEYCNLYSKNGFIKKIHDKVQSPQNFKQFIGLSYVHNYNLFWEGIKKSKKINNEYQVSSGFLNILKYKKINTKKFNWEDVGTLSNYKSLIIKYEKYDFSKENEFVYINKKKVIKFFSDEKKKNILVNRTVKNVIFPKIEETKKQFFVYEYIKGKTFYNVKNSIKFNQLLNFLEKKFWKKPKFKINLKTNCKKFYFTKTKSRINDFLIKYPYYENKIKFVNDIELPSVNYLLSRINWPKLYESINVQFHGDLQFDNIILYKNNFHLIDWRTDFGGNQNYGDLHYDLAKIYGGILINYNLIKKNKFIYKEKKNKCNFKIKTMHKIMKKHLITFEKYLKKNNLNYKKIKILTGLIYLNMAPLHSPDFDKILFNYGKKIIYDQIKH